MLKSGPEHDDNLRAAQTMAALLGGPKGMAEGGVKLTDVASILSADPDDDLSGLRLIAERMEFGQDYTSPTTDEDAGTHEEPLIDPETAREWLVMTGRTMESIEGNLTTSELYDHLGMAAMHIVETGEPGRMTEIYPTVTDNPEPFQNDFLVNLAGRMIDRVNGTGDFAE